MKTIFVIVVAVVLIVIGGQIAAFGLECFAEDFGTEMIDITDKIKAYFKNDNYTK